MIGSIIFSVLKSNAIIWYFTDIQLKTILNNAQRGTITIQQSLQTTRCCKPKNVLKIFRN
ncbi:hypothetical protein JCM15754A_10970 [Prevotella aurantiaca JCM 15754]